MACSLLPRGRDSGMTTVAIVNSSEDTVEALRLFFEQQGFARLPSSSSSAAARRCGAAR